MGEMDFDKSTQAKYWMYDDESLRECQEQACKSVSSNNGDGSTSSSPRVRKTASGYHDNNNDNSNNKGKQNGEKKITVHLSPEDQELLVHFHAHQIQRLIGPNAVFPALRRGSSVLSTAIMLFRRFYLSNSVIDFHPRNIAAASALLACKADCERRLPIDVLSHATWVIQLKAAHHAAQLLLCQDELRAVSIPEIEAAERALLQGCDYRLRCHHPYGAIKVLAADISSYLMTSALEHQEQHFLRSGADINGSPKTVTCGYTYSAAAGDPHHQHQYLGLATLCERALSVAQSALVYSDVHFLFPPGQIAFAAVAVALDGFGYGVKLGGGMRDYLAMRFRNKSIEELSEFEGQVGKIVSLWENCSSIDLNKFAPTWHFGRDDGVAERQASELRRVFHVASHFRMSKMSSATSTMGYAILPPPVSPVQHLGYYNPHPYAHHHQYYQHYHPLPEQPQHCTYFVPIHENSGSAGRNKRRREDDENYHGHHRRNPSALHNSNNHGGGGFLQQQQYPQSSHYAHYNHGNKVARVTPVMMDH